MRKQCEPVCKSIKHASSCSNSRCGSSHSHFVSGKHTHSSSTKTISVLCDFSSRLICLQWGKNLSFRDLILLSTRRCLGVISWMRMDLFSFKHALVPWNVEYLGARTLNGYCDCCRKMTVPCVPVGSIFWMYCLLTYSMWFAPHA